MLKEKLEKHNIILASGSPRRHQYFKELNIPFTYLKKEVEEIFDEDLKGSEITNYLAKLKASVYTELKPKDILITSDTIVSLSGNPLGKPKDEKDAFQMLRDLSGTSHQVITSICFTTLKEQIVVNETTVVTFKKMSDDEMEYYIKNYRPFDKAGAYGIQEWIGLIAITKIEGSYSNVVGLPTHLLYENLLKLVE